MSGIKNIFVICCCSFLLLQNLHSQNLEKIGKKDMVTVNGGMNFNSVFYDAQGMTDRRDPFTWYFNGNLNISILDLALPFTFSYTNNRGTYTQPFNMQSCHPKYKWAQAHIGTTSMNFSPYTLNGHVFTGGGIELNPKGIYFGAMYGRLNKAVAYDASMVDYSQMTFKRNGYAVKAGFDKGDHAIGITFFTAKDDDASLLFVPPDADLFAQENAAVSLSGKTKIWKVITLNGEFAVSGLTRNINSGMETTNFNGWQKLILHTRTTTQFSKAWKGSVQYSEKNISVSVNHEHVEPDYQTFGSYYFNNDFENWTVAPSFRLLKGKLSIGFNTGIQKNNLDQSKLNTMHRWVGSATIGASFFKWMNFSASYSNFTSYTNKRPQTDPFWQPSAADTLSFYQVSQQANSSLIFSFGNKKIRESISLIGSFMTSQQEQSGTTAPVSNVLNANVAWSVQFTEMNFSVTALANANQVSTDTIVTQMFGPGIQLGKSFGKNQLRISAGSVYNQSMTNSETSSSVINHRAQISYKPKIENKKMGSPAFSANANYVMRLATNPAQGNTGELTVILNLSYSF